MFYPNFQFEVIAGGSAFLPRVSDWKNVQTNIDFFVNEANSDTALIKSINPFSARITSRDGGRYEFLREVSVRICEANTNQCTPADEVFYIDNLQNRAGEQIDLLPTLRNVKKQLTEETYRLEIVFFLDYPSQFNIESQLDMTFQAVK